MTESIKKTIILNSSFEMRENFYQDILNLASERDELEKRLKTTLDK